MIVKTQYWIISGNLDNRIDKDTVGKWIIPGTLARFKRLMPDIDGLVESGDIYMAKYSHRESEFDPFSRDKPILLVYADDFTKESTLEKLAQFNLKSDTWKYNKETGEDWKLGGKLHTRYLYSIMERIYGSTS